MKIVSYLFKEPTLTDNYADGIRSAIQRLGGTIEELPDETNWYARFSLDGPGGIIKHRRSVIEAVQKSSGVTPVISRSQMQRDIAPSPDAGDVVQIDDRPRRTAGRGSRHAT